MATAPIVIIFILLATKTIDFNTLISGIKGTPTIKPWEILIIFFSTAYVSISTDITGIFDYLAYKLVHLAKGDGLKLFLFFYFFSCFLTAFTSNDIVILTLTPIILYLGRHSSVNVLPLLFAEFFGANTFRMLLYIGNPTNIIVANSLNLNFWEYTKVMWLPTVVAALSNVLLLYALFRKQIRCNYALKEESNFEVRNWLNAFICSGLLFAMILFLLFSQRIGVPLWKVTLWTAILSFINNSAFGIYYLLKGRKLTKIQLEVGKIVYGLKTDRIQMWVAFRRVPWKILPFIATVFIIVQAFHDLGYIDKIAAYYSQVAHTEAKGIFFSGVGSIILANIINNQPMSIFLSRVFTNTQIALNESVVQASAYATIISSNLGANITLIGALAGLMWKRILDVKKVKITYASFFRIGIIVTPITALLTFITLYFILN
jgi:arsenical pump membrane protein